jgi:hypothetical protein
MVICSSLEYPKTKTKPPINLGHEQKSMKRNTFLLKFRGKNWWLYEVYQFE